MTTRLDGPIPGDPFQILGAMDLASVGYTGDEFFLSGTARRYRIVGDRHEDGLWEAEPEVGAPFETRILTRRPSDPARFSGTVVVEWMNVSGGVDAAPDWLFLHRHLVREGAAWVGVSAQKAGIDGGGLVPGMPLKQVNAERYGRLDHPGDAYAYDIFTQVGRALRAHDKAVLGAIPPEAVERVIAVGESQSAGFLVTYVNAIDPLDRFYDGFLIHGRPATAAGIDGTYLRSSPDGDVARAREATTEAHRLRGKPRVPVIVMQSETDVVTLGSARARQPDGANLRLWEIAGAAHFDSYGMVAAHLDHRDLPVETLAQLMRPTDEPMGLQAKQPINAGPQQHYLANAALTALVAKIETGRDMPSAPRLETDAELGLVRDALGLAKGGIRTPWVEAPTCVLSGLGQEGEGFLFLFGTTRPLDEATLARLYPGGVADHRKRFEAALEACVDAGFILEKDAPEIRALLQVGRPPFGWQSD